MADQEESYKQNILDFIKLLCDQNKLLTFNFTYALGVDSTNVNEVLEFISKVPESLRSMFQIDELEEKCRNRVEGDLDIHVGQWCLASYDAIFDHVSNCQSDMNDEILKMLEQIAKEHKRPKLKLVH